MNKWEREREKANEREPRTLITTIIWYTMKCLLFRFMALYSEISANEISEFDLLPTFWICVEFDSFIWSMFNRLHQNHEKQCQTLNPSNLQPMPIYSMNTFSRLKTRAFFSIHFTFQSNLFFIASDFFSSVRWIIFIHSSKKCLIEFFSRSIRDSESVRKLLKSVINVIKIYYSSLTMFESIVAIGKMMMTIFFQASFVLFSRLRAHKRNEKNIVNCRIMQSTFDWMTKIRAPTKRSLPFKIFTKYVNR